MQIDLHTLREMRQISDEAALLHQAAAELRNRVCAVASDETEEIIDTMMDLVDVEEIDFFDVADNVARIKSGIKRKCCKIDRCEL